ncbi:unnamed protein product, partial [Discosporangium mesarthrocarpum]
MAQRGRGCLEIKQSSNPFFTTTNSLIGTTAQDVREFDAPPVYRRASKIDPVAAGVDWSFMYSKESSRIGSGVPYSDSKLAAIMDYKDSPGECACKKGLGKDPIMYEHEEDVGIPLRDATGFNTQKRPPEDKEAREKILDKFKHVAKAENPLYSTTNNDIGFKRPTGVTFTFGRRARQQGF